MTTLVDKLPEEHYYLLKRVLGVMKSVVDNSAKNGVTLENLAGVIGYNYIFTIYFIPNMK